MMVISLLNDENLGGRMIPNLCRNYHHGISGSIANATPQTKYSSVTLDDLDIKIGDYLQVG